MTAPTIAKMRISVYLILLAVVGTAVVGQLAFHWVGGFSAFVAYQTASGNDQVIQIYISCVEKKSSRVVDSVEAECVGRVIKYLFQAMGFVVVGGFTVGTVESGSGNSQENDAAPLRKRGDKLDLSSLEAINVHLTNVSASGHLSFATDVVMSDIPSFQGVAIRFNVHGDNTTLHVHTNGSHAIATFENGIHLGRRDVLPTDNHYYEFTGVNGLKMQAHGINHPSNPDYYSDLNAFAEHFARSNLQPRPIFQGSDSWDLQVCNKDKTATFFYGKLIVEMNRPGNNFEPMDPPGC